MTKARERIKDYLQMVHSAPRNKRKTKIICWLLKNVFAMDLKNDLSRKNQFNLNFELLNWFWSDTEIIFMFLQLQVFWVDFYELLVVITQTKSSIDFFIFMMQVYLK